MKTVALTFDDGPSRANTPIVLATLRKYGIKATFFMKGANVLANRQLLPQIKAEGHLIANHSLTHPSFHDLSDQQQEHEVVSTNALLSSHMKALPLFRYPYGNSSCFSNHLIKNKLKYKGIVGWHVDSCDWAYAKDGYIKKERTMRNCGVSPAHRADYVAHTLSSIDAHRGGIILMHDIHEKTALSLEEIIVRLQRKGYKFVNLNHPDMAKYLR